MKQEIKYIPHVCCPSCADLNTISHLMDEKHIGSEFTWWCDNDSCGRRYKWYRDESNVIHAEPTGVVIKPVSVLLQLPGTELKIIVKGSVGYSGEEEDFAAGLSYFYNERTCPANYFRKTESVWLPDDGDPHGLFEFVGFREFDENLTPEDFGVS